MYIFKVIRMWPTVRQLIYQNRPTDQCRRVDRKPIFDQTSAPVGRHF